SRAASASATSWSINALRWASVTGVVVVVVVAGDDLGGSGSGCFPWRHFLQNQKKI
ncbi:hypothetical protein Tco_0541773, partial [Tanacetum coccineum]